MGTLPPGPRSSLPSLVRYLRDPIGCMQPLTKAYGATVTFPGKPALVMTGDPAGIKAIYTADPDTFAPLNQDLGVFIGPRSLILAGGAEHKRARKLMMPPFHGARMRAYGEQMVRLAAQRAEAFQVGQTLTMTELLQELSLDVILQVVFGVTERAAMKTLGALLLEITNGISPLLALVPALRHEFGGVGPYARFLARRRRLHAALDDLIQKGRAARPREDVLSLLLAARAEDGSPMDDEEIRDQLLLLVVAGHETTAIAMAWALYALHRPENAAALGRLRDELATLGPEPAPEELAKLSYLEAVCNETLRRYPLAPAPAPRKLLRPFELLGYDLPAGVGVVPAISVAHFREDVYPDPMRFSPERFLDRTYSPFEFLPYGGGARRCLGAAMASHEMKLVLGTLLRRHHFRLASPKPDPGAVRAANAGPRYGVKMIVG
ncbi:cytochrome P450 [Polyangium spumosum]|nr:cytochrome P450 [Polyangium spumosum]